MPARAKTPSERMTAAPNGIANAHSHGSAYSFGRHRITDIQRARVLAATVEVSAERGAAGVTVTHIVERAGVSRRTFYEFFSDREDCFLAAFDDAVTRAARRIHDSYDPGSGWVERVRGGLVGLLCFIDAEPDTGVLLIVGSLGAGFRVLEHRKRTLARIVHFIDEGRSGIKASEQPPPLTAEGIVGGVLSVLQGRLLEDDPGPLLELAGPLMSMIVLPYLGRAAARRELARPSPKTTAGAHGAELNPFARMEMRLTYRTVRVLLAIAANPGCSNRLVATTAEVSDQGQMSKLLARLQQLGLIDNTGAGAPRGAPNAWTLTDKGRQIQNAIAQRTHE
jgi:AcrR family transcriptional regulator/DNA-binding MarR family transcriptional regulator